MKQPGIPRKLKTLVVDALRRHAWNVGVSHFKGNVLYMAANEKDDEGHDVHARMIVDRRYLTGTLQIYPIAVERWREEGDSYIESLVAHETAHLATQHFYDVATATYRDEGEMKDAWETLTEVIGRLSVKLDQEVRVKPRKDRRAA